MKNKYLEILKKTSELRNFFYTLYKKNISENSGILNNKLIILKRNIDNLRIAEAHLSKLRSSINEDWISFERKIKDGQESESKKKKNSK